MDRLIVMIRDNYMKRAAKNYKGTHVFYLELKPAANNKNIYDINFLLQYKIKFEQPHARHEISQC